MVSKISKEYDNNAHFEDGKIHLWAASCYYLPERSKGRINIKINATNEFYARKMNIITIIAHFCKFTLT